MKFEIATAYRLCVECCIEDVLVDSYRLREGLTKGCHRIVCGVL